MKNPTQAFLAIGEILIDKMFILAFKIKVFSLMQLLQLR